MSDVTNEEKLFLFGEKQSIKKVVVLKRFLFLQSFKLFYVNPNTHSNTTFSKTKKALKKSVENSTHQTPNHKID